MRRSKEHARNIEHPNENAAAILSAIDQFDATFDDAAVQQVFKPSVYEGTLIKLLGLYQITAQLKALVIQVYPDVRFHRPNSKISPWNHRPSPQDLLATYDRLDGDVRSNLYLDADGTLKIQTLAPTWQAWQAIGAAIRAAVAATTD